ncbi:MAG: flavodoxin family protein [Desulfobacteraceae bacterium]|nr:flavodoxin family protein [Desulfobacteraceae bacterium]
MKILNIYSSLNGNTKKIAQEIEKACKDNGYNTDSVNISESADIIDLLSYDLCFMGSGIYTWLPGKKMMKWIESQLEDARVKGLILPGSPRVPGKFVCVYATFGGPHTGKAEAVPGVKYMGQLFDHMGITIADEWYIPGEFFPANKKQLNIQGRLGNIEGRPNAHDLKTVYEKTAGLLLSLKNTIK